jgi:hypothetical protein
MRLAAVCVFALLFGVHPAPAGAQSKPAQPPPPQQSQTQSVVEPLVAPQGQPRAQSPPRTPAQAADASLKSAAEASVSAVSLERIKRGLRQAPRPAASPGTKAPLKLEYYVEVLGVAPTFSLFEFGDFDSGRIPYSAPSYSDMRNVLTAEQFRAPVVSLNSVARSGARTILDRSAQRARARRAEEARRKALQAERDRQEQLKNTIVAK